MATMLAAQIARGGAPFELVNRPIPQPGPGAVRIKVQACGICHSDALIKDGLVPESIYPRIPGHEVAGVIDALGPGVDRWQVGQRVGVGWNGGYCGQCDACRTGELFACDTKPVTGITFDGGYAQYMVAPTSAVARMPDDLSPVEAAPLMCAGITTFNALRNSGARPGDLIAVLGLGGLGHLGVQFAAKLGFHTVAIARGQEKGALAKQLGAAVYIDSQALDPARELTKLGGAKAILATVTNGDAMSAVAGGLGINGVMQLIGITPTVTVSPLQLLAGRQSVRGWYSGIASDAQDTLSFSARSGVRSMNEIFPLARVGEAYERMLSGKARFRVVLEMQA